MPITKNCEHCQAPYTRVPALAKESRFCSRKCCFDWKAISSKTDKRLQKICDNCSEPYYALPNIFKRARFCSRECYYVSKRAENKPLKTCEQCNKEYYPKSKDRAYDEKQKYCSNECARTATTAVKNCETCKSAFRVIAINAHLKYCSRKCTPRGMCPACGKITIGAHPNKRYCDQFCAGEVRKRKIKYSECAYCKKSFGQRNTTPSKHRKYCSRHCGKLASGITKTCAACKKDLFAYRLLKNKIYCSSSCIPRTPCILCGKKITKVQRKCCSSECRQIIKSMQRNHLARAFASAAHRKGSICCERCGYKQIAALTVHHKDRNRQNNTMENLEVVCANCHAIEHYAYSLERDRLIEKSKEILKFIDKIHLFLAP